LPAQPPWLIIVCTGKPACLRGRVSSNVRLHKQTFRVPSQVQSQITVTMKFEKTEYPARELVDAYTGGSLSRNPEYQRGAAWGLSQKQGLIDSVFREYPLPSLFLEVKKKKALGSGVSELFEIIDGQQRILALVEYFRDDFALLAPDNHKLRLPLSLRPSGAPWALKRYSELSPELRKHLDEYKIPAYLVKDVTNSDEIRDLFIRLQSGTALTRQQIRDAWPGQLGPRVEVWAGKLSRRPKYNFFDAVDGRGTRDDEDDASDQYVKQRTTCAQLCALLLTRQGNPWAFPSIKASDIDALYHEYTQVDPSNNVFDALEVIFDDLDDVIRKIAAKTTGRRKVSKSSLFALAMFLQDMRRSPLFKLNGEAKSKLAEHTAEPGVESRRGNSGGVIKEYYERWREQLPPTAIGVQLDPKRIFDDADKQLIWTKAAGVCVICTKELSRDEAEFDHFPTPHRDGGRTVPENGRAVHKQCHPRGRPPLDED